jgi:putative transposase
MTPSLVLGIFALLFSTRWLMGWETQWQGAQPVVAQSTGKRPRRGPGAPPKRRAAARGFYERIFSLRVTLWYLIFQRLNFDHTLGAVLVDVRAGGADRLARRRGLKLSQRVRSTNTSGYSQARQRLPLELLRAALAHLGPGLLKLVGWGPGRGRQPGPDQRPRQLLDGSTLAILLTPAVAEVYAPVRNQSGASDWCLMRILVGFCARSGAVLSAVEGALEQSEQALSWKLMEAAAALTIWIGDRNFGVWSVVAKAAACHQDVLVRLTRARAGKLCGGRPLPSGQERLIQWAPTRHDQTPPGLKRQAIKGRLIYARVCKEGKWIDLWLFTTLAAGDYPVALLLQWYQQRWQAELHFRSVKTQMQMAEQKVVSPEMARKEFYTGLLAYSLVRAVMWQAGERLEAGQQVLSFSQARRVVLEHLREWGRRIRATTQWIRTLVEEVAQHTLPKRSKKRPNEIRRVRHRRLRFPPLRGSRAAARTRDLSMKSS